MCFSKGEHYEGLIKRSTEVIQTQWQNFMQDSRKLHLVSKVSKV